MAILTGKAITEAMRTGDLVIEPEPAWEPGPNSIDLSLGWELLRYDTQPSRFLPARPLDPLDLPPLVREPLLGERGAVGSPYWLLQPGVLYLGATLERTCARAHVPYLDGRSSLGRLGVFAHVTAARGDVGFDGCWTVELVAVQPVILRPGMRLFQLTLHTVEGEITPYSGRYQGDLGPVASRIAGRSQRD